MLKFKKYFLHMLTTKKLTFADTMQGCAPGALAWAIAGRGWQGAGVRASAVRP